MLAAIFVHQIEFDFVGLLFGFGCSIDLPHGLGNVFRVDIKHVFTDKAGVIDIGHLFEVFTREYDIAVKIFHGNERRWVAQNRIQIGFASPERLLGEAKALGLLLVVPHVDDLSHKQGTKCPDSIQFGYGFLELR